MDESKEGILLIATTIVVMVIFAIAVLAVMLIYRKRKIQHLHEITLMNERFARELVAAENEVQQNTMQQIGRELHDNIGQQLTLAFLYLQQFQAADPGGEQKRNSTATILNDSLTDLRNLSRSLTDPQRVTDQLSLPELITRECDRIRESGTYEVLCEVTSGGTPTSAVKTFAYRIFQEFVQNSVRHSYGNRLHVSLTQEIQKTILMAADNGVGFAVHEKMNAGSGLDNMKKRADMIGADFSLTSVPGQGTQLRLVLPLPK
jgi:signal transduction histidine kinase